MANANNTQRGDNVSYEIANELEKLGFNCKSNFYYKTKYPDSPPDYSFVAVDYNDPELKEMISAPSYDMVFDWLLTTYGCNIITRRYIRDSDGEIGYFSAVIDNEELESFIAIKSKGVTTNTTNKKDTLGDVIKYTLLFYNQTKNKDGGEN